MKKVNLKKLIILSSLSTSLTSSFTYATPNLRDETINYIKEINQEIKMEQFDPCKCSDTCLATCGKTGSNTKANSCC